jgi:hypothetical protein
VNHLKPKPLTFKFKISPKLGYLGTIGVSVAGTPPSSTESFEQPTVQIVDRRAAHDSYTVTITTATPKGTYPLTSRSPTGRSPTT